jgi:anti-anti-sigma regulatory factor
MNVLKSSVKFSCWVDYSAMVFSFFKKRPEKMISRPPVVAQLAVESEEKQSPADAQAKDENVQDTPFSEDFSDSEFFQFSPDFQVNEDLDPVDAPAEEAAVLFSNDQDRAAQAILEDALKAQGSGQAERLWLMLFDLYRLSGQQSAFDAMGVDYARVFEKSPPVWSAEAEPALPVKAAKGKGGQVLFKGDLVGGNAASFNAVHKALEENRALRLDMSKVGKIDPEGCAQFLELLAYAGKNKRSVDLRGVDALIALAQACVEAGKKETPATGKECWKLLLELFQRQGRQEVFEELAIDYAVTFEESPPSWEAGRAAAPESDAQDVPEAQDTAVENDAADDGAYVLSGEVKSARFSDLPGFAQTKDVLLIDCAKLTRIDFVSAGALLNTLTAVRSSGKQIAFRHPNRLVAELFRVVGLTSVASVVFAKH